MDEKNTISKTESIALSFVRILAMILIVLCHLAQCYDLQVAYLLNVGVQVFFVMSGFLYGRLDSSASPHIFYKKRFVKVYLPYIIWFAIVMAVYAVFRLSHFNLKQIILYLLNLQWFSTPIDGLNHLWFLTVLMFGYLLTPWVKRLLKKYPIWFIAFFMICCMIEFVFVKKFYSLFAWIALYLVGILYGYYYSKMISNITLVVCSVVLTVLLVNLELSWLTQLEYRFYTIWLHWVLGLFVFALLFRILPYWINPTKKHAVALHLDKISYEVYLVHHPLILGPLSMLFLTRCSWLNVLFLLITVYVISLLLYYICSLFKNLI